MKKRIDADSEISLLFPLESERPAGAAHWGECSVSDLEIERLAWVLSIHNSYQETIKSILLELCSDLDVIAYRQEILEDLINSPAVATGLEDLLASLERLRDYAVLSSQKNPMQETLARMSELNTYITCIRTLHSILVNPQAAIRSQGLLALQEWLEQIMADEVFQALEKEIPDLLTKLNGFPSISIGVNLDNQLRPIEATILAIHDKPFKGGKLFDLLMARKKSQKPARGIGPLHVTPNEHVDGIDNRLVRIPRRVDPLMVPLFRDLYEMLRWMLVPMNATLKQFDQVNVSYLVSLETEIAFYLGAVALVRRMQAAGLPMCRPQTLPIQERSCKLDDSYNLFLALSKLEDVSEKSPDLKHVVVQNDVNFDPDGRVFILTGPNMGGKTVYTQSIGVIQVLFQAGLYVPANKARISPVDSIYTHFATLEQSDSGMGRLGEEAKRLNEIFSSASKYSLVLLNESLSSTSPGESFYLARDVVRALRLFGVRAVFATHLHELAEGVDAINEEIRGDSRIVSLVAGVELAGDQKDIIDDIVPRTFKVKPGPPRGLSYAKGIAFRYGISYEQLADEWQEHQSRGD